MELTEDQIRYGVDHAKTSDPTQRRVIEVAEHRGETKLTINCTQLGGTFTPQFASPKEKKRILREWCDYLKVNPDAFTTLGFGTRMPQELFDAACHQRALVQLDIKWGAYEDISAIENCQALRVLHIGSGARVHGLAPLTKLPNLLAPSVENFQQITDYAPLAQLRHLQSLSIVGDGMGPRFIKPDSLEFLRSMPQLRFFRLLTARLQSKDYRPILALQNLEHLTLRPGREVNALYVDLAALPRLTWGLLKEKPELYEA